MTLKLSGSTRLSEPGQTLRVTFVSCEPDSSTCGRRRKGPGAVPGLVAHGDLGDGDAVSTRGDGDGEEHQGGAGDSGPDREGYPPGFRTVELNGVASRSGFANPRRSDGPGWRFVRVRCTSALGTAQRRTSLARTTPIPGSDAPGTGPVIAHSTSRTAKRLSPQRWTAPARRGAVHRSEMLRIPSSMARANKADFVGAGRPMTAYLARARCRCVRTVLGAM